MAWVERNGVLVPEDVQERAESVTPRCPAASLRRFNTGRPAVYCGVEKRAFAIADSPNAALNWCCGPNDGYQECPVWQASIDEPEKVAAVQAAGEQAEQDAITASQIARGVRVDDRGQTEQEAEAEAMRQVNDDLERLRARAQESKDGVVELDDHS